MLPVHAHVTNVLSVLKWATFIAELCLSSNLCDLGSNPALVKKWIGLISSFLIMWVFPQTPCLVVFFPSITKGQLQLKRKSETRSKLLWCWPWHCALSPPNDIMKFTSLLQCEPTILAFWGSFEWLTNWIHYRTITANRNVSKWIRPQHIKQGDSGGCWWVGW